jgi:hypothetical protein
MGTICERCPKAEQLARKKEKRQAHKHGVTAQALRAAGFVPTPRIWVRPEDLHLIRHMTKPYQDEIERIRQQVMAESKR